MAAEHSAIQLLFWAVEFIIILQILKSVASTLNAKYNNDKTPTFSINYQASIVVQSTILTLVQA